MSSSSSISMDESPGNRGGPSLWSFKFKRNAYGDVGFNQIMAPSLEHAIEFAKDEFENLDDGCAPMWVDENTFKEVKDVNAYYDSFPLMD